MGRIGTQQLIHILMVLVQDFYPAQVIKNGFNPKRSKAFVQRT